ncbi:uncharacterized protein BDR25DRAFT_112063 [Lindgomyces ingoldianus]|uniref:Uncharacterized protein n=1 Tax=Lindgomyces ingoldianus TaxID=673940 RepID=A0ACB6R7S1_9PLEO|nr:uncharacterized protein BDR25DRAFT_112063 [Lindgomyces ingoldianus]KAF2474790.1 hypothetical protein BDR25DRAFT_112063 [Lindgomyces ingoldianus]
MSVPIRPVLVIYSHGRNPPLNPAPDLKYDIRSIPNPPKALRDTSDGRSKRIREHLLSEPKFSQKLELVEKDIRIRMDTMIAEITAKSQGIGGEEEAEAQTQTQAQAQAQITTPSNQEATHLNEEHSDTEDARRSTNEVLLRVGCNCALGHHRSVAFVCELAQRPWPRDWHVEVIHRDLEKKRSGGVRVKQKASWKDRGKRWSEHNSNHDTDMHFD